MDLKFKYCGGCKLSLSLDKFGKDKYRSSGLTTRCKECKNTAGRIYSHNHPEMKEKNIMQTLQENVNIKTIN
jgi:ribosomal protein S27E